MVQHGSVRSTRSAEQIALTHLGPRSLPDLRKTRQGRAPVSATATTPGGLEVLAVRRASSPMIEARLRIPFASAGERRAPGHAARAELLAETILLGTADRTRQQIDADLATVGGHMGADVNPQRMMIAGSVLRTGLDVLLDILADTLTHAAYRSSDVLRERDRLIESLLISNAQPASIARKHMQRHRFGSHPAAWETPEAEDVAALDAAAIRALHTRAVLPQGSTLVLVGDLKPDEVVTQVCDLLAQWRGDKPARSLLPPPAVVGGDVRAHHYPGAVQSQIRLTGPGVLRSDPDYAAAQLANIVFGGYFSSRLVENLREDKGFTYHAYSAFEFYPQRSAVTIGYDTTIDATSASLVEARYELARITAQGPTDDEVAAARRYAIGSLAGALATQAGYATMCSSLAASGLDQQWLRDHPGRLAAVTTDDVAAAALRIFAPAGITGIILTDLETTGADLTRLGGIDVETSQ